jgi:hypothetical protein
MRRIAAIVVVLSGDDDDVGADSAAAAGAGDGDCDGDGDVAAAGRGSDDDAVEAAAAIGADFLAAALLAGRVAAAVDATTGTRCCCGGCLDTFGAGDGDGETDLTARFG